MAALHYGADAVYLGMKEYSARADAGNFTLDELAVLVGVAHSMERPRKVYVAVNTLVRESGTKPLIGLLAHLQDLAVDALIVQDAAVVEIVRKSFQGLALHASTQLAIHSLEGAIAARKAGFSRVVAARELTVQELSEIASRSGVEVEAFIHGALCYSYSGLCLMSAMLNGASGNRGECMYVCRNKFRIKDENDKNIGECCPFSMKDLALGEMLPEYGKAGIASLKIEGRKKTPLYVAAVTNYYRRLLDRDFGDIDEGNSVLDVKTIFSRPWTSLFAHDPKATGVTDPNFVGPRGIDVGVVQKVKSYPTCDHLRFVLRNRTLEKHDGLQVELPGIEKPYGFGVDELFAFTQGGQVLWESVFTAKPGTSIEVPLPENHPELPAGAKISCTSSQEIKRRYSWPEPRPSLDRLRHPISFKLIIASDRATVISTVCLPCCTLPDIVTEMPISPALQPAKSPERLDAEIEKAFARLGDTCFRLQSIEISNPDKLYPPKSFLNELRRKAANDAQDAMQRRTEFNISRTAVDLARRTASRLSADSRDCGLSFSLKTDRPFLLNAFDKDARQTIDEIVLALTPSTFASIDRNLEALIAIIGSKDRIRIALPVITRGNSSATWTRAIKRLFNDGWRHWETTNIASFEILANAGIDSANSSITADWPLYTMNSLAAMHWLETGVSRVTACPEDTPENIARLAAILGPRLTIPLYQDTVLAYSAVCAMASIQGNCPGKSKCSFTSISLNNSRGNELLAFNDSCTTVILNSSPLDLTSCAPRFADAGARYFRADFLYRDHAPVNVLAAWRKLISMAR
ncbi:MAG: U32 family peptidase [Victivallales bacterium]|nr:U32 family peptidase [Victivallales bacterium]